MEAKRIEVFTFLRKGFKKTEISKQVSVSRMTVHQVEQHLKAEQRWKVQKRLERSTCLLNSRKNYWNRTLIFFNEKTFIVDSVFNKWNDLVVTLRMMSLGTAECQQPCILPQLWCLASQNWTGKRCLRFGLSGRGRWGNAVMRGKAFFFAIIAKLRLAKNFYLANSCTWQWNKLAQKMGNMAFLDLEIIIVIVFSHVWSNNPSR